MVMEAWTTFLYSFPLWIYLYSIVWLKKENYSPKRWFFVLCPHHRTPKFASTYLQQGVQLCCRCFKTSIFQTMPAEHTEIFSEGTVATSRKRKNKQKVGGHPDWCVLDISLGSLSTENISQGGRRFFGVFLNQAEGFPLHDHQTFFWDKQEWIKILHSFKHTE